MDDYERIIELYRHPLNLGKISGPTHSGTASNKNCGDDIRIELKVEDGKIADAKFNGTGCAISVASASLLTDKIKGMETKEAGKIDEKTVLGLLKTDLERNASRKKCALLPLSALKSALGV